MPSAVIKAFTYDPKVEILTITFISGRAYAYLGVPADVAYGLRVAFAKGDYFNAMIRDRYGAAPVEIGTRSAQGSLL
jgi:hypothetical protein